MTKKCYRYFCGLLQKQEDWLNDMANKGYRLIAVNKILYEFEECKPNSVEYRIGQVTLNWTVSKRTVTIQKVKVR